MLNPLVLQPLNKQRIGALMMVCAAFSTGHGLAAQANNTIGIVAMSNTQETTSDSAPNPFDLPFPFTADELTEKLLKVLDSPEGFISKEQVETIFNMSLPELDRSNRVNPADKSKMFGVWGKKNWYFDLIIGDNNLQRSHFGFGWGKPAGEERVSFQIPPMCIDPHKMMRAIEQRGWKLRYETRLQDTPHVNIYSQGISGKVMLIFSKDNKCVLELSMFSNMFNLN